MAQYHRSYLRPAAILCLTLAAACLSGISTATNRIEVYQATVPLADRSEAAQSAAFEAALRVVLVRATGRRSADEEAVFAPLVANARRYVQQYRSAPDNRLWVAFDGAALERWLIEKGEPVWGRERPSTYVWLAVQTAGATAPALSADDTSELKTAVDEAATVRGVPLIWPSAETAAAGTGNPADLGHRLGAEGVLIGRASAPTAGATVRWTFLFDDRSSEFSGALEGVNRAADLYAGMYAASGSLGPVEIEVGGVADLRDYAAIQSYLESLNFVTHVSVESLSGDAVRFRLTTRGGIETLQHAITLGGRLQPMPPAEGGTPRFQLRR